MLAVLVSLALWPTPWRAVLRALLTWQAARQGCNLTIDAIEGGPFDTFELYGLHCRQRGLPAASAAPDHPADTGPGTDLRVARAEITLAWTPPWMQRPASSRVRRITLEGVRGRWDLSTHGRRSGSADGFRWPRLDVLASRLVPTDFSLQVDDATLRRGRYRVRAAGLFLSASRTGTGGFLTRTAGIAGPGFDAAFSPCHGQTRWQDDRLTFSGLDLGHGILLARATLDGSHLGRGRLDWDGDLRALGGTVRGQGAVDLAGERLALDVGGSVRQVPLGPLARLLGITGPADGLVEQASFSFRGDPENWLAADLWLAGRATNFRWGQRRWESLEVQAVVTNRRVQVHRLELRQSRNRLSLDGECALLPAGAAGATGAADRWWQSGFACNVDARLEDLHALAELFGPPAPVLAGRMSVNGRISARPGAPGFDGYLNVEGSALTIRADTLDFLRSTLVIRGDELDVADLQATRDGQYLTGRGSLRLAGPTDFRPLGRVSIRDAAGSGAPGVTWEFPPGTPAAPAAGLPVTP